MDAIKNLLDNEKGIFGVLLIIGATAALLLSKMTVDQWASFSQWIFGIYAGSTAVHGGLVAIGTKSSLLTPPPDKALAPVAAQKGFVNFGFLVLLLIITATIATPFALSSCTKAKQDVAAIGNGLIECGKADLNQIVSGTGGLTLIKDVTMIAIGDPAAVDQLLTDLETMIVGPAVACAEKVVADVFSVQPPGKSTAEASPVAARLQAHMKAKGFKYAPSEPSASGQ